MHIIEPVSVPKLIISYIQLMYSHSFPKFQILPKPSKDLNSFEINDRKIKLFNDWEMSDNYIITTSRRWGVCF